LSAPNPGFGQVPPSPGEGSAPVGVNAGEEAVEALSEAVQADVHRAVEQVQRAEVAIKEDDRFRTWVAALIAAISVLGAIAAWQASNTTSKAGFFDNAALQETSLQEQLTSSLAATIDEDLRNRAVYLEHVQAAQLIQADANAVRSSDPTAAGQLDLQALAETRLATSREVQWSLVPPWVGSADTNVSELRQQQLTVAIQADPDLSKLNPARTTALADNLHKEANQLLLLVTLFVAALVFLTIAQFARKETRQIFAAAGVAVTLVALVIWPVVAVGH
jgi:hypothetical protein